MDNRARQTDEGFSYRDLNKNGRLDPYEDPRPLVEERVADLLAQMTLEEKAGLLFHQMAPLGDRGRFLTPAGALITTRLLAHFNAFGSARPREMATWYNDLQTTAAQTRLGIPVTISSDPRHAFSHNPGTAMVAGSFSQ
jgi:beta-glucosidase